MKRKLAKIEADLMRLTEGNLLEPVRIEKYGIYRSITKRIEALRINLLELKDYEVDVARRTNNAIASVAHDMKTPLAIISGYAECISDGLDDQDYPKLIRQKAEQMNDMVLTLIEDSRNALEKDAEQKSLQSARVYFSQVLKELDQLAETKNIKVKMGKIPNVNVRINSKEFGRVLLNLFTNAVKYSPAGSTITIKFKLWAKYLHISIKDEGKGIAKESLPYIFDLFYKEDKARTSSTSNGLGLYITKEIVRNHGGKIAVSSKKGKGSTFSVAIPVQPTQKEKLTLTGKFDDLHLWQKILVVLFTGWIFAATYRLLRYFETRNMSTLIFGLLCLPLFHFMWFIDFVSVCVYGRITFLAD